jgi:hypothetical protein
MPGLQLAAADRGALVLADISGYTNYLLGTELEHAQDVLSDLMSVVVSNLQPVLTVSKLEGDAVFAYALEGACCASTLLDTIEQSYFAFRSRQRDIDHATSCTCDACRQIPTLDLKFIAHYGSFVRRELAGSEELTGRDVIVLHRLSKNSAADVLGTKGYALLTDACVGALGLEPVALGMQPHVERYDDVGEVACHIEHLGERWRVETERERSKVPADNAAFDVSVALPVDRVIAWDWLTSPARRMVWQADRLDIVTPGGREGAGVTNHCMHGEHVIVEHVVDWRPFDYFTVTYDFPGIEHMRFTTEFEASGEGTEVHCRGETLTGDGLTAWEARAPALIEGFEANWVALRAAVVREVSPAVSAG